MNAVPTLIEEHATLLPYLVELRRAAQGGSDQELAAAIAQAAKALGPDLDGHISLEDDDFFPKVAAHLDPMVVQPFVQDHREIEQVRDAVYLGKAADAALRKDCLTLCGLLEDHIAREEQMLFPAVRDVKD